MKLPDKLTRLLQPDVRPPEEDQTVRYCMYSRGKRCVYRTCDCSPQPDDFNERRLREGFK